MTLEDWRVEIDHIDRELVRLINRRARVARKIGEIKLRAGIPLLDSERESEVIRNVCCAETSGLPAPALAKIFSEIIRESRCVQEAALSVSER